MASNRSSSEGRGVLLGPCSVLKEGLRGTTAPNGPGTLAWRGRGVLLGRWSVLKEGLRGTSSPNGPGTPAWGDGESCPGSGRCSRRACGGQQLLPCRAYRPGGTGSPAEAVVGAQGGPARCSSSQCPRQTSLGRRGVLPRRCSVSKEGLRGAAAPNGPGTLAWRDGQSCLGGGRCFSTACGGLQLPTAWAHQPRETGSPAQALVGAEGGPAGGSSFHRRANQPGGTGRPAQASVGALGAPAGDNISPRLRHTSLGGRGVLPSWWWVLKEGLRGVAVPNGPGTPALRTGRPAQAVVGALGGPAGDSSSQRPGHTSLVGRGVIPRRWWVVYEGLRGTTAPNGPGTPALRGRGILLKCWWVLKEGLRGAAVPNGPGTPA